jgi:hypothetical protein
MKESLHDPKPPASIAAMATKAPPAPRKPAPAQPLKKEHYIQLPLDPEQYVAVEFLAKEDDRFLAAQIRFLLLPTLKPVIERLRKSGELDRLIANLRAR